MVGRTGPPAARGASNHSLALSAVEGLVLSGAEGLVLAQLKGNSCYYSPLFISTGFPLLLSQRKCGIVLLLETKMGRGMKSKNEQKNEVQQGTLALMVLKTLDVLGPQHGYGIARRIEQISGDLLAVNQGTLYPVLLKLEQEGSIASAWGASENNRRARFYRLTRAGRKQLQSETRDWEQTAAIIGRFLEAKPEDL